MNYPGQRDPYGQALSALRQFAHAGRFGWGDPLVVKDLAEEIGLSPTPVREAMACLAGEGLIERRRGRGYFFPALTAPDIIDLYDLHWAYVHAALTLHAPSATSLQKIAVRATEFDFPDLFTALVHQTGNDALITAYERLLERLNPVLRVEGGRPDLGPPSAEDIALASGDPDRSAALRMIEAHHRQRCAMAGDVARLLQRAGGHRV